MDVNLLSAIIVAIATIIAAILGGIVGRSEIWERFVARNRFPQLSGTRWESTWTDGTGNDAKQNKERFEFTKQKRSRVYGCITMEPFPDLKWDIEGDYDGRFLRILWHPSITANNKFFLDYGCYFFERQGDGSFKGYAVGFDSHSNKILVGEHNLRQLP